MSKKNKEPEYILSSLNTPMTNYRVYIPKKRERLVMHLALLIIGGALGLVFYGGQFKDEGGVSTNTTIISNIVIFLIVGIIVSKILYPIRCESKKNKRKKELTKQFRSFLEALSVSLSSGMNMNDSLVSAYEDLKIEYSDDSYIAKEVKEMIDGVQNNIPIEVSIMSFGERSEVDDIRNFATVFETCYRTGGSLKDIVRRTNSIIGEKIEISEEITTALTSNKTQFTAMLAVPVFIMLFMRFASSAFAASFSTIPGIIAITVALCLFFAAYKLGQKITNIKG